ncbi:MAG: diheme cytochrome c [Nitrospirota bacterium]|nr:diheme cytochrome c [Nitrospirota bacterium]
MRHLLPAALLLSLLVPVPALANPLGDLFHALFGRHKEVAPVTDPLYLEECGACHFAFPPGLLPSRSWSALMDAAALEDHFGDDATLPEEDRAAIARLLDTASADRSWYKRSIKVRRSIPAGEAPLRISEVPYIKKRHHELTEADWKDNPKVNSMANCNACHRRAERAVFDDDTVKIPR